MNSRYADLLIPILLGKLVAGVVGMATALAVVLVAPLLATRMAEIRRRKALTSAVPDVARVVLIGLSAGQPPMAALSTAAAHLDPVIAGEVRSVLRVASARGSGNALGHADGPLGPFLASLARAQVTGASVRSAVRAQLEESRRERRRIIREGSQKLAIRLMVPVTLFILPGFVIMSYGPTVISVLVDTLGPLGGLAP